MLFKFTDLSYSVLSGWIYSSLNTIIIILTCLQPLRPKSSQQKTVLRQDTIFRPNIIAITK